MTLREKTREVIFGTHTPAGKAFDVALIVCILLSVASVMLDSVASIKQEIGSFLYGIEWFFTILFTIEYGIRLWCVQQPMRYARSFYGVIDLVGILPTYLSLAFADAQYLLVIRALRVLRIFRVLRLVRYIEEGNVLAEAIKASRGKITIFIMSVMTLVVIFGALIYLIEGEEHGFTSIPKSIYWAVITMTTVGYGDLVPKTPLGQAMATFIMIIGYGIIAVPTGIVTLELDRAARRRPTSDAQCASCEARGHTLGAIYCWNCGNRLPQLRLVGRESPVSTNPDFD